MVNQPYDEVSTTTTTAREGDVSLIEQISILIDQLCEEEKTKVSLVDYIQPVISSLKKFHEIGDVTRVYRQLLGRLGALKTIGGGADEEEMIKGRVKQVFDQLWRHHLRHQSVASLYYFYDEVVVNNLSNPPKIIRIFEDHFIHQLLEAKIQCPYIFNTYLTRCHLQNQPHLSLTDCQAFVAALIKSDDSISEMSPHETLVPEIKLLQKIGSHCSTVYWHEDESDKYGRYLGKALSLTIEVCNYTEGSLAHQLIHVIDSLVHSLDQHSRTIARDLIRCDFIDLDIILFLSALSISPRLVRVFPPWRNLITTLCRVSYTHISSTTQFVTAIVALVVALFPLVAVRQVVNLDRSLELFKEILTSLRNIEHFTSLPVSYIAKETVTSLLEEKRGPSLFLRHAIGDRAIRTELERFFEVHSSRSLELSDLTLLRPFRDHPQGGSGWDNTGNTCFVAACVNAFFLTSPLVSILSNTFQRGISGDNEVLGGSIPFLSLNMGGLLSRRNWSRESIVSIKPASLKAIHRSSPHYLSLQLLWSTLKCLTSAHLSDRKSLNLSGVSFLCPFGIGSQEDVFEFLQWMLNRFASIELGATPPIVPAANPLAAPSQTNATQNVHSNDVMHSEVLRLFTTKQTSILVCHNCGRRSLITETLNALLLPIDDHVMFSCTPFQGVSVPAGFPRDADYPPSPRREASHPLPTNASWPPRVSPPLDSASTTSSCRPMEGSAITQRRRMLILSDIFTKFRVRRDVLATLRDSPPQLSPSTPVDIPEIDARPPSVVSSVYDLGSETSSVTTRESSLSEISTDDQVALSSGGSTDSELGAVGVDCDTPAPLLPPEDQGDCHNDLATSFSEGGDVDQRQFFAVSTLYKQSVYNTEEATLKLNWYEESPDSLADLINRYLSYEYLTDYTCDPTEGCGILGQSGKQAFFERLPPIFILVLNRFRHLGQSAKICVPVMVNKFLAIPVKSPTLLPSSETVADNHQQLVYEIYEFYATIIHSGESLHSGHYTVFGRPVGFVPPHLHAQAHAEQQLWFLFDDKSVTPTDFACLRRMTLNQVDTPYVIFFKHIQTERGFAEGTDSPLLFKRRSCKIAQPSDTHQIVKQHVVGADTLEILLEKLEGVSGDKGTRASSDDEQDMSLTYTDQQARPFVASPARSDDAGPSFSSFVSGPDRPPTRLPSSPETQRPRSPLSGRRRRSNEGSPSDRPVSDSSAGRRDFFRRALRLESIRGSEYVQEPIFPLQLVLETFIDNVLLQLT